MGDDLMYIAYDVEDGNYLLHISLKNDFPNSIDKRNLLIFENNQHIETAIMVYKEMRETNDMLEHWLLVEDLESIIYGYICGELILRVYKSSR